MTSIRSKNGLYPFIPLLCVSGQQQFRFRRWSRLFSHRAVGVATGKVHAAGVLISNRAMGGEIICSTRRGCRNCCWHETVLLRQTQCCLPTRTTLCALPKFCYEVTTTSLMLEWILTSSSVSNLCKWIPTLFLPNRIISFELFSYTWEYFHFLYMVLFLSIKWQYNFTEYPCQMTSTV